MNPWVSLLLGGVTGAGFGGALGYFIRAAEFRREQRLSVYSAYMDAVQALALEINMRVHVLPVKNAEAHDRAKLTNLVDACRSSASKIRLIGSQPVVAAAATLEKWTEDVIASLPGDASKDIYSEAIRRSRAFALAARSDVLGRRQAGNEGPSAVVRERPGTDVDGNGGPA